MNYVKGITIACFLLLFCAGFSDCGSNSIPVELESLCIVDLEQGVCWIDEATGQYLELSEVSEDMEKCFDSENYPNARCWYLIDSDDLEELHAARAGKKQKRANNKMKLRLDRTKKALQKESLQSPD
jgi:hypothetical protein